MRIGLVVGEASGDLIGESLVKELKKRYPHLVVEGVFGPRLRALGDPCLYDAERLSVMGFIEPLKRLPELLNMRRSIRHYFRDNPPDVFIGIDAPDFTLGIEKYLKKYGIKTVHYVSPSVWAWRSGRIKTIKQAVDLMLVLFPFEEIFYRRHQIPVAYVGHPMARNIPLLKREKPTHFSALAILPGSRHSEIEQIAPVFLRVALQLKANFPHLRFLVPLASPGIGEHFLRVKASVAPHLEISLFDGKADEVLAQSDAALITSGTATLQAMLHACPMVVGFKTSRLNAWLIRRFYKHAFFALPNILCGEKLVEEYFQEKMTVDALYQGILSLVNNPVKVQSIQEAFYAMHQKLRAPAEADVVDAICCLIKADPLAYDGSNNRGECYGKR